LEYGCEGDDDRCAVEKEEEPIEDASDESPLFGDASVCVCTRPPSTAFRPAWMDSTSTQIDSELDTGPFSRPNQIQSKQVSMFTTYSQSNPIQSMDGPNPCPTLTDPTSTPTDSTRRHRRPSVCVPLAQPQRVRLQYSPHFAYVALKRRHLGPRPRSTADAVPPRPRNDRGRLARNRPARSAAVFRGPQQPVLAARRLRVRLVVVGGRRSSALARDARRRAGHLVDATFFATSWTDTDVDRDACETFRSSRSSAHALCDLSFP